MIGTINVRCNAAKPNFPLQPLFAFQGSPSSLRILDVPKSIGNWAITSVKVAVEYPDNTTVEKVAVRSGSVWVATVEGCEIAGKVSNGYSVLADGKDEDGNDVTGYVLGKGDVYVIENNTDISRLLDKIAVRYIEDIPDVPTKGDLMNSNGELRLFDGNDWILISTGEHSAVYDSQITIQKNGTSVGSFTVNASEPKSIDIPVPSRTSDIVNDSGFITVAAIPSDISSFNNDVGYITASALPTKVSELDNDAGYITASAITDKRDYTDLTFNTPSSAGRKPYTTFLDNRRWARAYIQKFNLTYDGTAYTLSEFIINHEYGMMWYKSSSYFMTTTDGTIFKLLDNDTNVMMQTTISLLKSGAVNFTYDGKSGSISLVSNEKVNFALDYQTMNGNLYVTSDNITIGTYDPTNVLNTYIDLSSKRNKTDMSAVVGTTYASWNLSALHETTYSPALELKWGTYNVFGEEQECWLVDDEYRQVCFFLMPELNMLYWGVRNQDGSYIAGYGEIITLSVDQLSIETINIDDEITCTRTSKDEMPETSTIATMKDLQGFQNINDKRDWWDNTTPASIDATGKFTINNFSVIVGSDSYFLDQFSASGGTSTWKSSSSYPTITTTDGLNFVLNSDSDTMAYFTMDELKPGPAKGTIGGINFNVYANFKLTTFALKDWVDANCTTYGYVDSNLNVSGIGCSTVTMSGTYLNSSTFSYNVVVQPSQ